MPERFVLWNLNTVDRGDSAAGTTMSCITDVECTNWDKSGKAEL